MTTVSSPRFPNTEATYCAELNNYRCIDLKFTKEDCVYLEEQYYGFVHWECYDNNDNRYVYYYQYSNGEQFLKRKTRDGNINTYIVVDLFLKPVTENSETDDDDEEERREKLYASFEETEGAVSVSGGEATAED